MKKTSFSYESMGTTWEIRIWDEISKLLLKEIKNEIINSSIKFDEIYSRFKKDSLVIKISKQTGKITVPNDFIKMLSIYKKIYALSKGAVTPLLGTTLSELGYDAEYSLTPKRSLSPVPSLDSVKILDKKTIFLKKSVLFDFGALGKGYFVDKITKMLQKKSIKRFLVNGSGDIYYSGNGKSIKVGLEHPGDTTKVIGAIDLKKGSICASSGNRRKWRNYNHIINPHTLSSKNDIIATWVMAKDATTSDALATCLFFSPPENFEKDFKFEYLILNKDYMVKRSSGFTAVLY